MTNVREVVGSTWMDIFHMDLSKNCILCLERPIINEKETGFGPLKKIKSARPFKTRWDNWEFLSESRTDSDRRCLLSARTNYSLKPWSKWNNSLRMSHNRRKEDFDAKQTNVVDDDDDVVGVVGSFIRQNDRNDWDAFEWCRQCDQIVRFVAISAIFKAFGYITLAQIVGQFLKWDDNLSFFQWKLFLPF